MLLKNIGLRYVRGHRSRKIVATKCFNFGSIS